jgi:hypothetical protein
VPPLKNNGKVLRILRLATLASEIAFWLGIAAAFLLLGPARVEGLPHHAPFDFIVRFLLLSLGADLLSILARLNFGERGSLIPPSIRLLLYLIFFVVVIPAFACA